MWRAGNDDGAVRYPAAYDDHCIAVGATRYDEQFTSYTNFGSSIDLVAPGGDMGVDQNGDGYNEGVLQQTFNPETKVLNDFGYWFLDGTSMSAPHVSGTAALFLSLNGVKDPDFVEYILSRTAEDEGDAGWDEHYSLGIVDAYAALTGRVPWLSGVSASGGAVGTVVTVAGEFFGEPQMTSNVSFDEVEAAHTSWSDTEIVCLVPAGASGQTEVTVGTIGGLSEGIPFSVVPELDCIDPDHGPVGATVTLSGSGFGYWRGESLVTFDGVPATGYGYWINDTILCEVPEGLTGLVKVEVITEGGKSEGLPFNV
ncbi:MAG: S8 family serine peptidase [Actinomycetota bacterium]|nr:S8 family serine peptidase [Actinomycetota bacterium]